MHIRTRNVHLAYPAVLDMLEGHGVKRESRNGPVDRFAEPVIIEYTHPTERVCFWPERDANPFFHLIESLWMLAGRNDVAPMSRIVKNMASFSDDGETFHGAYGYRWRRQFKFDQVHEIIKVLKENPDDRRCVLQMWESAIDLNMEGKDFPCNVMATFEIDHRGELNMSVFNRSNDIVWGALGANAVHFSVLQEYMAAYIGVPVGRYYQISTNLHAYLDTLAQVEMLADHRKIGGLRNPHDGLGRVPLVNGDPNMWDRDLDIYWGCMDTIGPGSMDAAEFYDPFFAEVAQPLTVSHYLFKNLKGERKYLESIAWSEKIADEAWRIACVQWIERRYNKWQRAADDGVQYDQK